MQNSKILFLETEVLNSQDPEKIIFRQEDGFDQAYNNIGCQPSVGYIENTIKKFGKSFIRVDDKDLNSGMHFYDWEVKEDLNWRGGRRKFWIIQ